jgi:hypothetical protein
MNTLSRGLCNLPMHHPLETYYHSTKGYIFMVITHSYNVKFNEIVSPWKNPQVVVTSVESAWCSIKKGWWQKDTVLAELEGRVYLKIVEPVLG